jgi:thymidine kinase
MKVETSRYDPLRIVLGPMCAGKSAELLDIAQVAEREGALVYCVRPELDTRSGDHLRSRDGRSRRFDYILQKEASWVDIPVPDEAVILVDEIHFLQRSPSPSASRQFLLKVLERGSRVVAAGLFFTTEFKPFDTTLEVVSWATSVSHRIAYCTICREVAQFAICKVLKEGPILVGDSIYEPRCTRHLPTDNPNWKDDASST